MQNIKTIYILGAESSYISEAIEICEEAGYKKIFCVDNLDRFKNDKIDNYPVIKISEISKAKFSSYFICCLHTPNYRKKLINQAKQFSIKPISVFHPKSVLSKRAVISDKGVLIAVQAIVGSHTIIDDYVLINRGVLIGHDVKIASYCTIESGVSINGFCKINENSYIGSGAVILPQITIGKNCLIAAGSVVRKNVPDNCLVAGVPAVIKRQNIAGYLGDL